MSLRSSTSQHAPRGERLPLRQWRRLWLEISKCHLGLGSCFPHIMNEASAKPLCGRDGDRSHHWGRTRKEKPPSIASQKDIHAIPCIAMIRRINVIPVFRYVPVYPTNLEQRIVRHAEGFGPRPVKEFVRLIYGASWTLPVS